MASPARDNGGPGCSAATARGGSSAAELTLRDACGLLVVAATIPTVAWCYCPEGGRRTWSQRHETGAGAHTIRDELEGWATYQDSKAWATARHVWLDKRSHIGWQKRRRRMSTGERQPWAKTTSRRSFGNQQRSQSDQMHTNRLTKGIMPLCLLSIVCEISCVVHSTTGTVLE